MTQVFNKAYISYTIKYKILKYKKNIENNNLYNCYIVKNQ